MLSHNVKGEIMKRKVLIILLLIICILVSACGGFTKLDRIQATDYFSKIKCEIPIKIPSALPTSEYLHTDETIEQLKEKLDKLSKLKGNFVTESLPYNALMIVYSENDKTALYLFHEYSLSEYYEARYKHMYRFSDFSSYLHVVAADKNGYRIRQINGIPIPHYMFEMSSGDYYEKKEILVKGSIDGFYEFYQTFKKYYAEYSMEIKKEDNILTLKNVPVSMEILDGGGRIQNEPSQLKEVIFTFSKSDNGERVVTISYIN
jgi:hypothetical protein